MERASERARESAPARRDSAVELSVGGSGGGGEVVVVVASTARRERERGKDLVKESKGARCMHAGDAPCCLQCRGGGETGRATGR